MRTSTAPWLSVRGSAAAAEFYQRAFNAAETYRLEGEGGGVVARLNVDGAEFWVSEADPETSFNGSARMILSVANPDAVFDQAIEAGATEVFPVSEEHGWRLGRVVDPFGLHWEIGRELSAT